MSNFSPNFVDQRIIRIMSCPSLTLTLNLKKENKYTSALKPEKKKDKYIPVLELEKQKWRINYISDFIS